MNKKNQNSIHSIKYLTTQSSSTKITKLVYESSWLIMVVLLFYLIIILFTYSCKDPNLFTISTSSRLNNWGGYIGAWLADLLLFIFGISAWWWCVLLLNVIWRNNPYVSTKLVSTQIKFNIYQEYLIRILGFIFLLIGSVSIEYLYSITIKILRIPGGILGRMISNIAQIWFGFTGSTLFLILFFILGISLFFQISWLTIIKCLIKFIKNNFFFIKSIIIANKNCNFYCVTKFKYNNFFVSKYKEYIKRSVINAKLPTIKKLELTSTTNQKNRDLYQYTDNTNNLPPLSLLNNLSSNQQQIISAEVLEATSRLIEKKIFNFGIEVKVVAVYPGPVITCYEIKLAIGVKSSQILSLARDLARSLLLPAIRVVEVIPGKEYVGLELPNLKRRTVHLIEILSSKIYSDNISNTTIALGKDISNNPIIADLNQMPHLLIAGTTGSGKSISIHGIILSILYKSTPKQVNLILIDPKMVELSVYQNIPHLLMPVVTNMCQVTCVLEWVITEMEKRLQSMSNIGVRNLQTYNNEVVKINSYNKENLNSLNIEASFKQLPIIVIIIDELADLMMIMGKKIEEFITRIAQKSRAAGIHLVLATQRPSVDVVTGLIKANIPARIAFQLNNKIDSRTILNQSGAESLLGMGDMLYISSEIRLPIRIHGAFVSDNEIHRIVNYLKKQGTPNYVDNFLEKNFNK